MRVINAAFSSNVFKACHMKLNVDKLGIHTNPLKKNKNKKKATLLYFRQDDICFAFRKYCESIMSLRFIFSCEYEENSWDAVVCQQRGITIHLMVEGQSFALVPR